MDKINYFDVVAYSASAIKSGAVSMLKMQDFIQNGIESNNGMRRGTAQHMALLEPENLSKLICIDYDGRTKAGKDLVATHGIENIIKPAAMESVKLAASMVRNHPEVVRLDLFNGGESEKEIYWQEDGLDCKCKIDYYHADYIIEYKSTSNLAGFCRLAAGMNYQLQLGWYWHGSGRKPCYVVAQEQKSPYDVAVFEVSQLLLKTWYEQAIEIVKRYHSGDRSGAFPMILNFELPVWADKPEVIIDAEDTINF